MSEKTSDEQKSSSPAEPRKTLVDSIKEHLPNPAEMMLDQVIQMFIQWYNRRILILSLAVMFLIPTYMITIGSLFFHSCQTSVYLPLHMIICGSVAFISATLLVTMILIWKKSIKFTSNMTCHKEESTMIILALIETVFLIISLIGIVLLTITLVNLSKTLDFNKHSSQYCHPILYYSSYAILFLFYNLLSSIMIILFLIFHAYQKTQWQPSNVSF